MDLECDMPYTPTSTCFDFGPYTPYLVGISDGYIPALEIWPNPSRGILNLQSDRPGTAQLFDIRGIPVTPRWEVQDYRRFDLTGIAGGLYFLRWTSNEGKIFTQKILVQP